MIRLLKPCSAADQQGVSGLWTPPAPSELPTIWIRGTAPSAGQIRHSRLYLQNICFSYLTAENLRKIKMALAGKLFLKSPQTQLHTFVMIWGAKCNKPGGNTNPASMYQKIRPVPSLDKCESCTRNRPGGRLQHASPTWREKNTTALHPQSRPGDSRRQGEVTKHQCAETNNFRLLLWKKSSWFWAGQVDTDVILIWE